MFSTTYYSEIKNAFDKQMTLLDQRCSKLQKQEHDGIRKIRNENTACVHGLSVSLLSEKKTEILHTLASCTEEEAQALTFLYSAMPFSDLVDYPASLFLAYAKHGVFLWNHGAFAGRVPEELFANYVLHYRVNNEDIADTRGFFYDRVTQAVDMAGACPEKAASSTMYDIAIDVNYWCAREATYRSTDGRTQNPRTMFGVTTGRCGEESTFGVTALRSIGIPARQIYAPLWTHCDDNHAWVELWCDGKWYFMGACEPEEEMNRGWFTGPASRGVMLHSRWFGKDMPKECQVGPKGMAKVLNHMERYAETVDLKVKVEDEKGNLIPNAKVDFQVLNYGGFGSVALVYTGSEGEEKGIARLKTGFGDLFISVSADTGLEAAGKETYAGKLYGEAMISLGSLIKDGDEIASRVGNEKDKEIMIFPTISADKKTAECKIVLGSKPECWEGWRELDVHAPGEGHMYNGTLTASQQEIGEKRLVQAAEYRQKKAASFYDEREAERALGRFTGEDRDRIKEILYMAHGNMGEIVRFLEWDADAFLPEAWLKTKEGAGREGWKRKVLDTLSEKDYWDIKAEVLMDCCMNAFAHVDKVPEEIFYRYILCPRVSIEMLRPCRVALETYWETYTDDSMKEAVRQNPETLFGLAEQWIKSIPEQEYEGLITSPLGCLKGGVGSSRSREVFCVDMYRALGIPARLNRFDHKVEYYKNGTFVACDGVEKSCTLTLCVDHSLKLSDSEHYSLERFEGDGFCRLGLWGQISGQEDREMELKLTPGIYRIITTNRKKDGDQLAKAAVFELHQGESRRMDLSLRDTPIEDMLTHIKVTDFALKTMEGEAKALSALTEGGKALFLWLGVTREPTEHILNELYERKEQFASLKTPIYAILKAPEDLGDKTLRRTLEALPMIRTVLDDFGDNYCSLAQAAGQAPGKLPLAVILDEQQECIYSDAGYNVGLADMLYKILI